MPTTSKGPRRCPPELRERAVGLVREAHREDPALSQTAAHARIGKRLGVHHETLRTWVEQAEVDAGRRPGPTTADSERIKALEREVKEPRRANEILLAASSFFAREPDPRSPR